MAGMILVTGATGTVGSELVRLLAGQGLAVRAMTRDPSRVRTAGAEAVRGDFADRTSLDRAVAGASALFLLTAPGKPVADHDLAMLDAARRAGVRRVVKLSAIGGGAIDDGEGGTAGGWHLAGERAARESGMAWTVLRPTTFASNTLSWADAIRAGQPVPNPAGDGRQGVIDPRDVAAVAYATLTSEAHDAQTYTLTGPELLTAREQAAQIGAALGRTVEVVDVTSETMREQLVAAGADPGFADLAARGMELVRRGGNAVTTDDVALVLGRPAGTFAAWAHDHRDRFLGGGAGTP
jgi:uncharacterized protein YbjT (DUF2867 family)